MGKFSAKPNIPETKPVPQPEDPEIAKKKKDSEMAAKNRAGLGSTIKTSGLGVTNDAQTQRKTLLG
jgi:hypothetical protein